MTNHDSTGSTGSTDSFEVLAAADPVLGQSEDGGRLAQIRERVLARTRAEDDAQVTVDRRFRSRKVAWVGGVAAACALVAVGGLGGAAISAGGGGSEVISAGSPMMPTMGNGVGNGARESGLAGDLVSQSRGGAVAPGYAADAKVSSGMSMPYVGYYGSRTILEPGAGITDESGSASGYVYTLSGLDERQVATAVAAAFGITDAPVEQGGDGRSWMAGPVDGSGPAVWVGGWGSMVNWSYSDPGAYVACDMPAPEPQPAQSESTTKGSPDADSGSGSGGSGGGIAAGEPSPVCTEAGTPPSEKEAVARAKDLLVAIGVDPSTVEWEAYRDDYNASVTAWQMVDGQRTSMAWSFAYSQNDRLQWASGFAADLVPVPAYPIVGARTAIERMKDPRWNPMLGGGPIMYAARDTALSGDVVSSDSQSSAVQPAPSEPVMKDGRPVISMPVATVVIDRAELGLTQYTQPDGSLILLPAYVLTAADGSTWSVLAITEDYVDFSLPQG